MADTLELLLLAVALAMDCFTVSTVCGVILRCRQWRTILLTAFFFGAFQAFMPYIGWLGTSLFASQLEAYDHWIAFSLLLFLGGKEKTTLKEMEELLGKETIDTYNTGESRGREVSHSLNYQKLGKSLMSVDELAVMDGGKCILQLRGVRPFLSDKYDITSHPNYKYLSDSNPRNAFNIEKFLSRRLKLRLEEEYAAFEVSVEEHSDDDEALMEEWTDITKLEAAGYGGLL